MTYEERKTLERELKKKKSLTKIAAEMGFTRQGLYYELWRNNMNRANYSAYKAQMDKNGKVV